MLSFDLAIGIALIVGFCICWGLLLWAVKEQGSNGEVMSHLFREGVILRLLAVIFIAVISGYLFVIDKLSPELLASLYSGIAGYVLGGIKKTNEN